MTPLRHVPLSVLDLAPVTEGSTPGDALNRSLDLARHVEGLGYSRFWVAEHHNMPGIASSAPAVIIAHLAAGTERLRVGSGGVMLPNHAPLVVAEQFGTLEALHPGRIDLGLGRAPGTDGLTAYALRRGDPSTGDDFPAQLGELIAYFEGRVEGITAVPGEGASPEVWLLGSSGFSAQLAGYLGLPFAFAYHFSPANLYPALRLYREAFRPVPGRERPHAMVCVGVICAETDDEAQFLAGSQRLAVLALRRGRPRRLPPPEDAVGHVFDAAEQAALDAHVGGHVVGSRTTVRDGLATLLEATGADELMIGTTTFDHGARRRSYELLAEVFAG